MKNFQLFPGTMTCLFNGRSCEYNAEKMYDENESVKINIEAFGPDAKHSTDTLYIDDLREIKALDLPEFFSLSIYLPDFDFNSIQNIVVKKVGTDCSLEVGVYIYYHSWKHDINLTNFCEKFMFHILSSHIDVLTSEVEKDNDGLGVYIETSIKLNNKCDLYACLTDIIQQFELSFNEIIKHIEVEHGKVVATFKFPSHIENACQQYLIYFSEFLSDLGINAETELKKDNGDTLFSILPNDKDEALENIRNALGMYLQLPDLYNESEISIEIETASDILLQKYMATIEHLRSQLRMSHIMLATVQSNALQNETMNPLQNYFEELKIDNKVEDKKSFFGGAIKVGTWKKGGLEISAPKLIDGLNKLFSKNKT